MPPEFTITGRKADFFVTYGWTVEGLRSAPGRGYSSGIARLRDGVSFEQASAEMKTIAAQLAKEFPDRNTGWSVTLVPVHEHTVDQIRPAILVLAGAVLLVLLIACVNVANLLLARSTVRKAELGLRAALGAGRARLIRQMLTESILLGTGGGAAGLVLAFVFHRGLLRLVAGRIPVPRIEQVALDWQVVAVTFGLALGTGLLFGAVPALITSRSLIGPLRQGGRQAIGSHSRRLLGAHVVAEIAFALVLLVGAGLLIRSFVRLQETDPGFRAGGLLTARVQVPAIRYSDPRRSVALFNAVIAKISAAPGVQSAAGASFLPMAGAGIGTGFYRADRPAPSAGERPSADVRPVTPGFFRTMGIPLLAGRDFTASDTIGTRPVAVVSEAVARRYFPAENPIGRPLVVRIGPPDGPWEIVGIAGDIKMNSLDQDIRPAIWISHAQLPVGQMSFVARTEGDPLSIAGVIRESVRSLDPELAVADVLTMEEVVAKTLSRPRTLAALLSVFAAMALLLAGVGVYGVMAYSVAQRTPEIGVRIALGASRGKLIRKILGEALLLAAAGLGIGLAGSLALARVLESQLAGVSIHDPTAFACVTALLGATAMIASLVPAWRAASVDPLAALRGE
jgi:putative ABC transport system permease protein